jgi:hypothetical protein
MHKCDSSDKPMCTAGMVVAGRHGLLFRGSVRPAALWEMPPIEGGEAPTSAGAERRTRWLALRQSPSLQRKGNSQPMTRAGAPIGASPRRFPQASRPPSLSGQGRPYGTPLIPRDFPRVHPPPPAGFPRRTHGVGPGSVSRGPRRPGWLSRTLRRRIPPRSHAPHENALGRVGPRD